MAESSQLPARARMKVHNSVTSRHSPPSTVRPPVRWTVGRGVYSSLMTWTGFYRGILAMKLRRLRRSVREAAPGPLPTRARAPPQRWPLVRAGNFGVSAPRRFLVFLRAQQLRQLGDVGGGAPGLVAGEHGFRKNGT
jgi:hypothetical protein